MSRKPNTLDLIAEEAAEWFTLNRTGTPSMEEREAFGLWLQRSPLHVQEYLGVAENWEMIRRSTVWPCVGDETETGQGIIPSNVVELPLAGLTKGARKRRKFTPPKIMGAIAIMAMVAMAVAAMSMYRDWSMTTKYATGRGEQRSIVLEDGSVVQLNTLSKIRVHYDDKRRRIELLEGEAYFTVAHNRQRPFDVVTNKAIVRAVGTAFNVYARGDALDVDVVEGRVRVTEVAHGMFGGEAVSDRPYSIGVNEGIEISGAGAPKVTATTSSTREIAWRQRRLVFDNERLDVVVAEFNRYSKRQMEVRSPRLAGLRISGTFNADEPETLATYLQQIQGVDVSRQGMMTTLRSPESDTNKQ